MSWLAHYYPGREVCVMSRNLRFEVSEAAPPPEPTPPPGGWLKPSCTFESHQWELELDGGRASISCADPCDPSLFDPAQNAPVCQAPWDTEDYCTPSPIPVALTFVDDSTPSTPAGPAEYGFYIEVRVADGERQR